MELDHQLLDACNRLDLNEVGSLLARGANVNARNDQGMTPLLLVIERNERAADLVKVLLEHRADITLGDSTGFSPFAFAILAGNVDVVRLLLKAGANPNGSAYSDGGENAYPLLFDALFHSEITQCLIDHGAEFDSPNGNNNTPLVQALQDGSYDAALVLIKAGADVNARSESGRTALMLALDMGHEHIEKLITALLDAGANVHAEWQGNKWTALHIAACDAPEAIPLLLKAKANIEAPRADGNTPLLTAADEGCVEGVRALLKAGANPHARDEGGNTAMMHFNDTPEALIALDLLLQAGVNPHLRNEAGQTALHVAARSEAPAIVQYMLDIGIDHTVKDDEGNTAMDYAIVAADSASRAILEYHHLKGGSKKSEEVQGSARKRARL